MNPSAKTIRLLNRTLTNLSMNLHQLRAPASPGIRRALLMTPINIAAGAYYDMCAQLQCSMNEAQRIIDNSPEVRARLSTGQLIALEFPPPVDAPEPPPLRIESALPGEVPAAPTPAPPAEAAPAPAPAAPAPAPVIMIEEPLEPTPVPEPETPAEEAPALMADEPSMDWSEDQLRAYAKKHRIDVSKAKSKTAVLRAIRTGR